MFSLIPFLSVLAPTKNLLARFELAMDLSPFRQNFEENRNSQKYHHSLKEHPMFTKIAKFRCEML